MSEWYVPKYDDIDVNFDEGTVDILVKSNDQGNVYLTMSYEQIDDLHRFIHKFGKG